MFLIFKKGRRPPATTLPTNFENSDFYFSPVKREGSLGIAPF